MVDQANDVSADEYLTHRRTIAHLFELAPHEDPSAFLPEGPPPGAPLFATIRAGGGRRTDVRLLADDGETYLTLANALAGTLRCDVYLTPNGADVRYTREPNPLGGELYEATAVDRETGEPTSWVVVRPPDLPTHVATWFVSTRGRLRPNGGLITVALPDGMGFATKNTFRDTAYLAGRMRTGTSRITTLAVNADLGRFEISRFDDTTALLGGVEFATLVAASLDLIHPDVQIALTWPADAAACASLDVELMRVADALNRTVWVPEPQGAAFVLPGCGEFAAVDEVGGPSRWRSYPSRLANEWRPTYGTDLDGRLAPVGDVSAATFPTVPVVSVDAAQLSRLRGWYDAITPRASLFPFDLAALGDGRLAVLIKDANAVAVAPREMRALLREAGWAGEDLLLLTQPPAGTWDAMNDHIQSLIELLQVDIWVPSAAAWERAEQSSIGARAEDWYVHRYGRPAGPASEGSTLPPPLPVRPPAPPPTVWPILTRADAAPTTVLHLGPPESWPSAVPSPAPTSGAPTSGAGTFIRTVDAPGSGIAAGLPPLADESLGATGLDATRLGTGGFATVGVRPEPGTADFSYTRSTANGHPADAARRDPANAAAVSEPTMVVPLWTPGAPSPAEAVAEPVLEPGTEDAAESGHAVPWLPKEPVLNRRAMDLYLWTPLGADAVDPHDLPSADLFLLAGQDPLRLAERHRDGCLLRVAAAEQTAVDLLEHAQEAPAPLRQRLLESGSTHLLPLAWFGDLRVTARFDLDGRGGVAARHDIAGAELAIRFEGADHGVVGLPNDVEHWPEKGAPASRTLCYLVVPDGPLVDQHIVRHGYVALTRKKPAIEPGSQVLEIKIKQRRAIDVPATLGHLDRLPIAGRMHDFVGLDLLLPAADLGLALVTRIWRPGPGRKPIVDKLTDTTLQHAVSSPA
jgi:hypothetical protein